MMKKITPDIVKAINSLIDDWGSTLEIENRTGISNSVISKYRSGKITRMNMTTWTVLSPYLSDYLPPERQSAKEEKKTEKEETVSKPVIDKILEIISRSEEFTDEERGRFLRVIARNLL